MGSNSSPLGDIVPDRKVILPPPDPLPGTDVALEPVSPSHAASLFVHLGGPSNAKLWTYLPAQHPSTEAEFDTLVHQFISSPTAQHYAVMRPAPSGGLQAEGLMSFINAVPAHRHIELGVILGPSLQRTRAATEGFYLLLRQAFDVLGYQRVEWKADSLNKASRAAVERLGFTYDGTFRKHMVVRGRRRDTAWFSITDDEWPILRRGFRTWLAEDNFDGEGRQKRSLKECRDNQAENQE